MSHSSCSHYQSKKPTYNHDYFLHIKEIDVKLFGLNAAAILSVIKAGEKWRHETNLRNKKANDIAEMHGDNRWLPEDVSLGFTNQDLIARTFGICGRNGVVDAIKILQTHGVVSQHANPNKKYHSDKGRYFCFHQDVYKELMRCFKEGDVTEVTENLADGTPIQDLSTGNDPQLIESNHRLDLNDAPFKNKRQEEGSRLKINGTRLNLNAPHLNSDSHIRNSNNINKNIKNNKSINTRRAIFEKDEQKTKLRFEESIAVVQVVFDALVAKGFPSEGLQYPDAVEAIQQLLDQGASIEHFEQAHDLCEQITRRRGKGFGLSYLIKAVSSQLDAARHPKTNYHRQVSTAPPGPPPETHYENDFSKGLHWMGDLLEEDNDDEFTATS